MDANRSSVPSPDDPRLLGPVVGLFRDSHQAQEAIAALREAGFAARQLGVAFTDGNAVFGGMAGEEARAEHLAERQQSHHASLWDRIVHFFSDEPSIVTPAGTASDARGHHAHDEELVESLRGLDIPDEQARYFAQSLGPDGAIVTVSTTDRREQARDMLVNHGADLGSYLAPVSSVVAGPSNEIDETPYHLRPPLMPSAYNPHDLEQSQLDAADVTRTLEKVTGTDRAKLDDAIATPNDYLGTRNELRRVQLLGEVLRVHKERIARGEVVVRKRTVTETQRVTVPVEREELVIEELPPEGDTTTPPKQTRIVLNEERVHVEKQPVVREEVEVGTRTVQETKQVTEPVRREVLRIEDEPAPGTPDSSGRRSA